MSGGVGGRRTRLGGGRGGERIWLSEVGCGALVGAVLLATAACGAEVDPEVDPAVDPAVASVEAATGLDFDYYVSNVEPIFSRLRGGFTLDNPGGPSCVMCHTWQTNAPLKLESLEEGAGGQTSWTEEQSGRNFVEVARLVTPGDPDNSRLLRAPLANAEGGRGQHTGG